MRDLSTSVILLTVGLGLCYAIGYNDVEEASSSTPPVVSLYYESLCPGCRSFSKEQLCPTRNQMGKYFKIEFIPYGNAQTDVSETGEITITCQHGPEECAGNRLHSCALKTLSYNQSTDFICCMESSPDFDTAGPACAKKFGINFQSLNKCAEGPQGTQLHYQNGIKTSKLDPPHQWVPWILINGRYDQEEMTKAEEDLISVLCKYLDPKPSECNEVF